MKGEFCATSDLASSPSQIDPTKVLGLKSRTTHRYISCQSLTRDGGGSVWHDSFYISSLPDLEHFQHAFELNICFAISFLSPTPTSPKTRKHPKKQFLLQILPSILVLIETHDLDFDNIKRLPAIPLDDVQ